MRVMKGNDMEIEMMNKSEVMEQLDSASEAENLEAALLEEQPERAALDGREGLQGQELGLNSDEELAYQEVAAVRAQDHEAVQRFKEIMNETPEIVGGAETDLPVEGQGSSCGRGAGCMGSHWCGRY